MELGKKNLHWSEDPFDPKKCYIDGICDIDDEERKKARVLVFPSHVDRKTVTFVSVWINSWDWPSLQKIVVPRGVETYHMEGFTIEYK